MVDIIVSEYLSSLKEKKELDLIFPLLLSQMGFKVLKTPKSSRGQSEYGCDVAAIGIDEIDKQEKVFVFELKAGNDKNLNSKTFHKDDGVKMSLEEAKYVDFSDNSIPKINKLPQKIVYVHTGVIQENFRPIWDGFIEKEFKPNQFERWDLYKLADLFSKNLFNEYILVDETNIKLFKRTLVLLDVPENDYSSFKQLVQNILQKEFEYTPDKVRIVLATFRLIAFMLIHYSREINNLIPAKRCIDYLVLNVWSWILEKGIETKPTVKENFLALNSIQFLLYDEYFSKVHKIIKEPVGLFYPENIPYESIGYPIKCMEYLGDWIYYFEMIKTFSPKNSFKQKEKYLILKSIIDVNLGTKRPLIDSHSIPISLVLIQLTESEEREFASNYLYEILENICITREIRGIFPEQNDNMKSVIKSYALNGRPQEYHDKSSCLITKLFEFTAVFNKSEIYYYFKDSFKDKVNLQIFYPDFNDEFEVTFFKKMIYEEGYVETSIKLEDDFENFKSKVKNKANPKMEFRTDKVGFSHLKTLAHTYYKTHLFPNNWRKYI